jgi:hypothetical protein
MKLQPEWFQNGYYVYVVVLTYKRKNYFYIGMTGDRKHTVARSPFYRMGGHFMLGTSTQNQIIKGIENKLGIVVKDDSDILCKMNITYYAWLINPYFKNISKEEHHRKRDIGEKIESALIVQCKAAFSEENVFNKTLSRKDFVGYELYASKILEQLKHYINE